MQIPFTYEHQVNFNNRTFIFKETFTNDFSKIDWKIRQSLGVVLNDKNEVLLASEDNIKWTLPGGTIEKGETPEQTLLREVYEETAALIDEQSVRPMFYNIAYEIENGIKSYDVTQFRYFARLKRLDKFLGDPGGNMQFRKFVPLDELEKSLNWSGTETHIKNWLKQFILV